MRLLQFLLADATRPLACARGMFDPQGVCAAMIATSTPKPLRSCAQEQQARVTGARGVQRHWRRTSGAATRLHAGIRRRFAAAAAGTAGLAGARATPCTPRLLRRAPPASPPCTCSGPPRARLPAPAFAEGTRKRQVWCRRFRGDCPSGARVGSESRMRTYCVHGHPAAPGLCACRSRSKKACCTWSTSLSCTSCPAGPLKLAGIDRHRHQKLQLSREQLYIQGSTPINTVQSHNKRPTAN